MELHAEHKLKYAGAVDADGHILEPKNLWETYLEPKYRERALRFILDDNNLEQLVYDNKPSKMAAKGTFIERRWRVDESPPAPEEPDSPNPRASYRTSRRPVASRS